MKTEVCFEGRRRNQIDLDSTISLSHLQAYTHTHSHKGRLFPPWWVTKHACQSGIFLRIFSNLINFIFTDHRLGLYKILIFKNTIEQSSLFEQIKLFANFVDQDG